MSCSASPSAVFSLVAALSHRDGISRPETSRWDFFLIRGGFANPLPTSYVLSR